jgi:hypothetical protein
VSTHDVTALSEPALIIDTIKIREKGANYQCSEFSVTYNQTAGSSIQNLALVTFHYLNIGKYETSSSNNVTFEIDIKIDTNKAKLGDIHIVSATFGDFVSECKITFNKPEVLGDQNGMIVSQVHKVLDGNHTTCLRLPQKGDVPPIMWMKVHTSWLNISSAVYYVTVVGMHISCAQHGQRTLQVY